MFADLVVLKLEFGAIRESMQMGAVGSSGTFPRNIFDPSTDYCSNKFRSTKLERTPNIPSTPNIPNTRELPCDAVGCSLAGVLGRRFAVSAAVQLVQRVGPAVTE